MNVISESFVVFEQNDQVLYINVPNDFFLNLHSDNQIKMVNNKHPCCKNECTLKIVHFKNFKITSKMSTCVNSFL